MEQRIGPYRLLGKLGRGGMAEVFTAVRRGASGFQRTLCVKRVLPQYAADAEFRELFSKEALLAGQLCHSNIVQVVDCVEDGSSLALVMERVDGMDLKALILRLRARGVPPSLPVAAYIAGQVLNGLAYAHNRRIVHRDISPHNILVSREGEIKITDFGVAKLMFTLATRTNGLKGKLAYMSPEQASGGAIDRRTDLYSLGLVLYELLTGERFFARKSRHDLLRDVIRARQPRMELAGPELAPLVERLLAPNKERRFPSAREALNALPAWPEVGPAGSLLVADLVNRCLSPRRPTVRVEPSRRPRDKAVPASSTDVISQTAMLVPDPPAAEEARDTTPEIPIGRLLPPTMELPAVGPGEPPRAPSPSPPLALRERRDQGVRALGERGPRGERFQRMGRKKLPRRRRSALWVIMSVFLLFSLGICFGIGGRYLLG